MYLFIYYSFIKKKIFENKKKFGAGHITAILQVGKQSPKQLRNVPCYLGQAPDPCSIPSDSGESEAELECSFADARFSASRTDPGPHLTVTMPHEPGKSGVKAPISPEPQFLQWKLAFPSRPGGNSCVAGKSGSPHCFSTSAMTHSADSSSPHPASHPENRSTEELAQPEVPGLASGSLPQTPEQEKFLRQHFETLTDTPPEGRT